MSERVDRLSHFGFWATAFSLVASSTLEECVRAYFIVRIVSLWRSPAAGLAVSVAFSVLAHLYYGTPELLHVAASATFYGAVFLARRDVLPLVCAHSAYNLVLLAFS